MTDRLLRGMLIALLAIGSLAIWIAIPAGWLWVTKDISAGARFLIVIAGCVASMLGAASLLYRLEGVLDRAGGTPVLDRFLVASAVVAVVALVVWWAFFADSPNPSGPLQPV